LLERAAAEIDPVVDPDRYALLQEKLASLSREISDSARAARADAALATVVDRVSPSVRAQMMIEQSETAMIRGSFDAAYERTRAALAIAEETGRTEDLLRTLIGVGRASGYLGRLEESSSYFERARAEARRAGDRWAEAAANKWEGDLLQAAGRFEEAIALLRTAIDGHNEVGQTSDADHAQAIVAQSLHRSGRWTEAEALLDVKGVRRVLWSRVLHSYLLVQQGRFDDAAQLLENTAEFVAMSGSSATFGPYYSAIVEMHIWKHEPEAALAVAEQAKPVMDRSGDMRWIGELRRLGIWAAADIGLDALSRAQRLHADLVKRARARRETGTVFESEIAATIASATAEMDRLTGESDPTSWANAAAAWASIPEPYPQAYALYREAEALVPVDRKQSAAPLREAQSLAARMGAAPLQSAIENLARRSGVPLDQVSRESTDGASDGYGLTSREREVLSLIARGRTDQEIAKELFISPKTASVHVSNVKGKLGASSRIEAASMGLKLGLGDD
jgi:DNA-binding CsgD family transcriptional regulator